MLKKFIVFICVLLLVSGCRNNEEVKQNWVSIGKPEFKLGSSEDITLKIAQDNTLYVAFIDSSYNSQANIIKLNNKIGSWNYLGKPGISEYSVNNIKMQISNDGEIYTAYTLQGSNKVIVKKFNPQNGNWISLGNPGTSVNATKAIDLVISREGALYIAYVDSKNQNKISVKQFNEKTSSWNYIGKPGFTNGYIKHGNISLTLDKNNVAYAAYIDSSLDNKISLMQFDISSNNWVNISLPKLNTDNSNNIKLKASQNSSDLYLAYSDSSNGNKVTVLKYNTLAKNLEYVGKKPGISTGNADEMDFNITNKGTLYIAYSDGSHSNKASVMKFDSLHDKWSSIKPEGFSTEDAVDISIDNDKNENPYVAFSDSGNKGIVTIMALK